MIRPASIILFVVLISLICVEVAASYKPQGQYVIKLKGDIGLKAKIFSTGAVDKINMIINKNGKVKKVYGNLITAEISPDYLPELAKNPDVEGIYVNKKYHMMDYALDKVNAGQAWSSNHTGFGIKIAVLDTGIDDRHEMLIGKVIAAEDFSGSASPADKNGHGTHVAALAAGNKINESISGVAYRASLLNAKVLDDEGYGNTADIAAGIGWAVENKADIISMSLGGPYEHDELIEEEIKKAYQKGITIVVAGGNCGECSKECGGYYGITSPGNSEYALTVGAIAQNNSKLCFSGGNYIDYRIKPDISAPGENINSAALNSGYALKSGTSMSAPLVSGAVALYKEVHPGYSPFDIKAALESTAKDLGKEGRDIEYGSGMLDIGNLLNFEKEDIALYDINYPKEIVSGEDMDIALDYFPNTSVEDIDGYIEKPDGSREYFPFHKANSTHYTSYRINASTHGKYRLYITTYFNEYYQTTYEGFFVVRKNTSDMCSIADLAVSGEVNKNSVVDLSVSFETNLSGPADVEVQLVKEGDIFQQYYAGLAEVSPYRFSMKLAVPSSDYIVKAILSPGACYIEKNMTVIDAEAPILVDLRYKSQIDDLGPFSIEIAAEDDDRLHGMLNVTSPDGLSHVRYINESYAVGNIHELSAAFDETLAIGAYNAVLAIFDAKGNAMKPEMLSFNVTECSKEDVLVVKYENSGIEDALDEYCVSIWDKAVDHDISPDYLNRFKVAVWQAGSFPLGLDEQDIGLMQNYGGNLLVEGDDVLSDDARLGSIVHAELKEEISPKRISVIAGHPATEGVGALSFDNSKSSFPDSVNAVGGASEIAQWDGGEASMVVYDGSKRVVFIPFSLDALSIQGKDKIIANSVDWLMGRAIFNLTLKQGWNLISLPLEGHTLAGLPTFAYSGGEWIPNSTAEGFWIKMQSDTTIAVKGKDVDNCSILPAFGLTLSGYHCLNRSIISSAINTSRVQWVYGYDQGWQSFYPGRQHNTLSELAPGYGYWIKWK